MRLNLHLFLGIMLLFTLSCTPVKRGPTESSFIAEGQPNLEVSVSPSLTLAGSGQKSIQVKTDRMLTTPASITYSVFAPSGQEQINKHAHIFMASLPGGRWMFSPETYPSRYAISTSQEKINGKNFTLQVLLVPGEKDWFNELWKINKYKPSDAWLAMRWSTNPNIQERIVAEYREPLPTCLRGQEAYRKFEKGEKSDKLEVQIAWISCKDELEDFRQRAYNSFSFESPTPGSQLSGTNQLIQTIRDRPDFTDLVGEAEHIGRDSFRPRR